MHGSDMAYKPGRPPMLGGCPNSQQLFYRIATCTDSGEKGLARLKRQLGKARDIRNACLFVNATVAIGQVHQVHQVILHLQLHGFWLLASGFCALIECVGDAHSQLTASNAWLTRGWYAAPIHQLLVVLYADVCRASDASQQPSLLQLQQMYTAHWRFLAACTRCSRYPTFA